MYLVTPNCLAKWIPTHHCLHALKVQLDLMARTSPTHESVINELDRAMTFAFIVVSEMARGQDLMRLRKLANETKDEVRNHPLGLLELGKKSHPSLFAVGLVSGVMNTLQSAVIKKMAPELPDLSLEWINLPPLLSAADLEHFHHRGFTDLVSISEKILNQVDSSFPAEAKPFISLAQFDAVSRAVLPRVPTKEKLPIHIPSLVGVLHANFLNSITAGRSPSLKQEEQEHFVQSYCEKSCREHFEVVKNTFQIRMVQRLFPKAVDISIPLGKYYCWGALCAPAPSARELLRIYSALNRAQTVSDSKFRPKDDEKTPKSLSSNAFIRFTEEFIPHPLNSGRGQIYFDTDRSDIKINGLSIQKHGVMAISYAAPLTDIEHWTTRFGVFLLHARRTYCRATRGTFLTEEADALMRISAKADELKGGNRVLLHDKSSVLAHLCALMDLEMQQDPEFSALSSKAKVITISDWLSSAGFTYSIESIRKSCEKRSAVQQRIQDYLSGL